MGLVKEPSGIDFVVRPTVLTAKNRQRISSVIAEYKQTGKLPSKTEPKSYKRKKTVATHGNRSTKTIHTTPLSM